MPIHLPPISRRRFLAQSLAAAAGLALSQGCVTPPKSQDEHWALLSDIHIAADPKKIARNVNMTDNLKAVVREVAAWKERPEAVLVNGDLAFNSGEIKDYASVIGLLRPLQEESPLYLNLGNHDNRERFSDALPKYVRNEPGLANRQVMMIRARHANWFLLDSLVKTLYTPGQLGEEQRAWLARELDANAGKPAIVALHHPPQAVGKALPLEDAKELLEILRPRRQVKACIFGHTHHWDYAQDESGIYLINLPPIGYVFDKPEPLGWVRATFQPDGAQFELRCLDVSRKKHGQTLPARWRA